MFINQCKKKINNRLIFTRFILFHSSSYIEKVIDEISKEKNNGGSRNSIVEENQINISNNNNNSSKKHIDLNSPKGTRDFYPDEQRLKNWLFTKWKSTSILYGFEEYDAPILENEDLYIRKSGEEITDQLYNFIDKGGRRLSLRPEMTPSLARMVLKKKNGLVPPLKWYSIAQCWRYERMSRGRRREHYQWNMDIWGIKGIEAESELLSSIVMFLKNIGLTSLDVKIKINNRKILTSLMNKLDIPVVLWSSIFVLIDKIDKIPLKSLQNELELLGLSTDIIDNLFTFLKIKDLDLLDRNLIEDLDGYNEIKSLFHLSKSYGFSDWLEFDSSIVRGLSYYTGIVFECVDRKGELRAICGGGRYDKLLESMGDVSMPAVGFGFGDAVIIELLKDRGLLPDFSNNNNIQVIAYAMDENLRSRASAFISNLRYNGINVDFILDSRKPKWVFNRADKIGVPIVLMFAHDESINNQVVIKTMRDGKQSNINEDDAIDYINKFLIENNLL